MAEMNWDEVKTGGSGEGTPFIKLQSGPNQMRIVGLPYETEIHWEEAVDDSKKRIVCSGAGCPICKEGHLPQKKFQVLVIDRADKKLKILEGGTSIFKQIKDLAMDPDYGNPKNYDIKIKKEGQGRETKYSVLASPNKSSLTQEEEALLAEAKTLEDINKPKTLDEIIQMNLKLFDNNSVNGDWGVNENAAEINNSNSGSFADDDWNEL